LELRRWPQAWITCKRKGTSVDDIFSILSWKEWHDDKNRYALLKKRKSKKINQPTQNKEAVYFDLEANYGFSLADHNEGFSFVDYFWETVRKSYLHQSENNKGFSVFYLNTLNFSFWWTWHFSVLSFLVSLYDAWNVYLSSFNDKHVSSNLKIHVCVNWCSASDVNILWNQINE
jgi:hypothetical protein